MDTPLISRIQRGDAEALKELWLSKQDFLIRYAHRMFKATPNCTHDSELAVQSALHSFWTGIRSRKYVFEDENCLTGLLVKILRRKVIKQTRSGHRKKRKPVAPLLSIDAPGANGQKMDIVQQRDNPSTHAESQEELQRLFSMLGDPFLEKIVILKMDNESDGEVAKTLHCSRATVARKLKLIREIWALEINQQRFLG